ncbi:hypothetical protein L596_002359 [Steinernema carpocapsae]|uniref:Uncharacterized protein n=1 Tax=Steinernema carpocapsae TaxID=34508 RepID=A0A4U8UNY2_STECR|nr:hypothetical protein L596_002359 [Steinernema carpocapsae]
MRYVDHQNTTAEIRFCKVSELDELKRERGWRTRIQLRQNTVQQFELKEFGKRSQQQTKTLQSRKTSVLVGHLVLQIAFPPLRPKTSAHENPLPSGKSRLDWAHAGN